MTELLLLLAVVVVALLALHLVNRLSYCVLKNRVLKRQKWDLNICCGKTDGGGVNADIVRHCDVPRFARIADIYDLPFEDGQFDTVLCSHTMEHVEDPDRFFRELQRVGRSVTIVIPPLWDLFAMVNLWKHRWIFLTLRKDHSRLPPRVRLPLSSLVQGRFSQRVQP